MKSPGRMIFESPYFEDSLTCLLLPSFGNIQLGVDSKRTPSSMVNTFCEIVFVRPPVILSSFCVNENISCLWEYVFLCWWAKFHFHSLSVFLGLLQNHVSSPADILKCFLGWTYNSFSCHYLLARRRVFVSNGFYIRLPTQCAGY